jgi:hypothetical protein
MCPVEGRVWGCTVQCSKQRFVCTVHIYSTRTYTVWTLSVRNSLTFFGGRIHWFDYQSMDLTVNPWIWLSIHGFDYQSMELTANPWIFQQILGFDSQSMDLTGNPWTVGAPPIWASSRNRLTLQRGDTSYTQHPSCTGTIVFRSRRSLAIGQKVRFNFTSPGPWGAPR